MNTSWTGVNRYLCISITSIASDAPMHSTIELQCTIDSAKVYPQQNISVSVQHTQCDRSIGSSIDPLDSSNMIIEFD